MANFTFICAYDKTFNLLRFTTLILHQRQPSPTEYIIPGGGEAAANTLESNSILPQKLLRYYKAVVSKIFLRGHHH
jgi:hypothetical protein